MGWTRRLKEGECCWMSIRHDRQHPLNEKNSHCEEHLSVTKRNKLRRNLLGMFKIASPQKTGFAMTINASSSGSRKNY
jgi:hypothetical protein